MLLTFYGHGFEQALDLRDTRTPLPFAKVIMKESHILLKYILSPILWNS